MLTDYPLRLQQDLYAQHVEFGFDEGERAKEVAMLAKRLKAIPVQ